MSESPDFAKLVPGFDFLQNLVKNAGAALPNVGQWVAPTLDPDELDKRIGELRTVQFWLEQNAAMLGTTIQALEVQRMTLATLKNMNVQMTDLRDALTIRMPDAPPAPPAPTAWAAPAAAAPEPAPAASPAAAAPAAPAGVVDPMQWWSALTRQFTELAATALRESAADAANAASVPKGAAATPAPAGPSSRAPAKKATRKSSTAKRATTRRRPAAGG